MWESENTYRFGKVNIFIFIFSNLEVKNMFIRLKSFLEPCEREWHPGISKGYIC